MLYFILFLQCRTDYIRYILAEKNEEIFFLLQEAYYPHFAEIKSKQNHHDQTSINNLYFT